LILLAGGPARFGVFLARETLRFDTLRARALLPVLFADAAHPY